MRPVVEADGAPLPPRGSGAAAVRVLSFSNLSSIGDVASVDKCGDPSRSGDPLCEFKRCLRLKPQMPKVVRASPNRARWEMQRREVQRCRAKVEKLAAPRRGEPSLVERLKNETMDESKLEAWCRDYEAREVRERRRSSVASSADAISVLRSASHPGSDEDIDRSFKEVARMRNRLSPDMLLHGALRNSKSGHANPRISRTSSATSSVSGATSEGSADDCASNHFHPVSAHQVMLRSSSLAMLTCSLFRRADKKHKTQTREPREGSKKAPSRRRSFSMVCDRVRSAPGSQEVMRERARILQSVRPLEMTVDNFFSMLGCFGLAKKLMAERIHLYLLSFGPVSGQADDSKLVRGARTCASAGAAFAVGDASGFNARLGTAESVVAGSAESGDASLGGGTGDSPNGHAGGLAFQLFYKLVRDLRSGATAVATANRCPPPVAAATATADGSSGDEGCRSRSRSAHKAPPSAATAMSAVAAAAPGSAVGSGAATAAEALQKALPPRSGTPWRESGLLCGILWATLTGQPPLRATTAAERWAQESKALPLPMKVLEESLGGFLCSSLALEVQDEHEVPRALRGLASLLLHEVSAAETEACRSPTVPTSPTQAADVGVKVEAESMTTVTSPEVDKVSFRAFERFVWRWPNLSEGLLQLLFPLALKGHGLVAREMELMARALPHRRSELRAQADAIARRLQRKLLMRLYRKFVVPWMKDM